MQSDFLTTLLDLRAIPHDEREAFLSPVYESLHDPFLFADMEKSVTRLFDAMSANEKIVIYSDYDADGIPGGVILHDLFKKVGYANFENYIPHRHDEGYGLHMEAVKGFIADNVKVIITVDLGITTVDEVAAAQAGGIDVIITDHHLPHGELPKAFAILDAKKEGETYPFKDLCGAGVAFKLAQGFLKKYGEHFNIPAGWEKWLLDMAGLATLSDMVPLHGENRIIAHFGMTVLKRTRRPGLVSLFHKMKLDVEHLSEDDLTFMLTPRLNAASRMDSPMRAFEVLSETDEVKAKTVADHLTKINDLRKTIVATIMKDVHKRLEKRELKDVIVIGDPEWRVGVLGLIASKITETYGKPSFVWGIEGAEETGMIKGSCRSEGSVNVVDLMTAAKDAFHTFGGHELAGGFVVTHEQVHFLEDALIKAYPMAKREVAVDESPAHDLILPLTAITRANYEHLSRMSPFGLGNDKPVFLFESVEVTGVKEFGKTKEHLEIIVSENDPLSFYKGKAVKAIAFFKLAKDFGVPLEVGSKVNLLGTMEMSYFMGRPELRLRIVDII
jgi:single-stranded-DNA-specific exonuclease